MEFIKTLHQANHALVDAYEKSMKQQRMDKKQMREELKTQLARARAPEVRHVRSWPCLFVFTFHASDHSRDHPSLCGNGHYECICCGIKLVCVCVCVHLCVSPCVSVCRCVHTLPYMLHMCVPPANCRYTSALPSQALPSVFPSGGRMSCWRNTAVIPARRPFSMTSLASL